MTELEKNFSDLYDGYIDKIYRFVYLKVSSKEVAEDLTSEAFLRSWKAMLRERGGNSWFIENPSAFLYQIARNLVVDHYREKGRFKTVTVDNMQIHDKNVDLEKKAVTDSDLEIVKLALFGLKEDYKDVVVLHYLDDLTISETAKIMAKSEGAVRVTLHRALAALRSNLNNDVKGLRLAEKEA